MRWSWGSSSHGPPCNRRGRRPPPAARAVPSQSPAEFQPVLNKYCITCHNQRLLTGGLALDTADLTKVADDAQLWEKVVRKLAAGAMPPAGVPRPDAATHAALLSSLEATLDRAARTAPNPGPPTLRRLNRFEYANAVRDLLALDVDSTVLLPPDDSSSGFDNNSDVLGVSPLLLEGYLSAARKISALAVGDPTIGPGTDTYPNVPDLSQSEHLEGMPLGTRGGLLVRHRFPLEAEYVIKIKLLETTNGSIKGMEFPNQIEILIDGARVHQAEVGGPADLVALSVNPNNLLGDIDKRLTARVVVKAGTHVVAAVFPSTSEVEGGGRFQDFLRSNVDTTDWTGLPHVSGLTIVGPYHAAGSGDTPSRRRVFVCHPLSQADEGPCAKRIISTLARRAYRRPATDAELERLMAFYQVGRREQSFDGGVERALRSILASPKFVFRPEVVPANVADGAAYPVGDFDLASRLSFFLWSSIPDDELLDVASRGRLKNPAVLQQQVRRMLADPRADTLVTNFADQWLQLRNLRASIPDQNEFPDFDDNLRQAFRQETQMLVASVMHEDRSVVDLLTADYTFVNERLAKHYGIPNIYGSHFRRVAVTDDARKGLLGKGAILLVTSHPDRTSPVVRGKWILENLLGTPPPPPPPNVPPLAEGSAAKTRTMREQMEAHRANPACASCHKLLDPLGFALENFDAVGAWRVRDAGVAIDASGQLTDGTRVNGVVTLRQALVRNPDVFVRTFVEKLMTYALGRGLNYYDGPAVRAVVREGAAHDYRFSAIVLGIVTSTPFQMRTKQLREHPAVVATGAQ